jgi:hypothetical protein
MKALEDALSSISWHREHAKEHLISEAKSLAERMSYLAEKLEQEGYDANFNELGEIQSDGCRIDNLCGKLRAYEKSYSHLKQIERQLKEVK